MLFVRPKKIKNIENINVKNQLYECFNFQMKQKSVSILFCKKELSDQFLARSDKHKIDCGYRKYKQHLKCYMALFFFVETPKYFFSMKRIHLICHACERNCLNWFKWHAAMFFLLLVDKIKVFCIRYHFPTQLI